MEASYPQPNHPAAPITYTGRFSLEPAPNSGNTLWPEPLFSLVSGLVSMTNPPATSSSASSPAASSSASQSPPLSPAQCSPATQQPHLLRGTHLPHLTLTSSLSHKARPFRSSAGPALQYPPPAYPGAKGASGYDPELSVPQQQGDLGLGTPDQKPFQGVESRHQQPSLTPLSTIKAFATQSGSQDLKALNSTYQSLSSSNPAACASTNRPSKTPPPP